MGVADVPADRRPVAELHRAADVGHAAGHAERRRRLQLMKIAIAKLTPEDLVAVASYVSSRLPPSAAPSDKRMTQALVSR